MEALEARIRAFAEELVALVRAEVLREVERALAARVEAAPASRRGVHLSPPRMRGQKVKPAPRLVAHDPSAQPLGRVLELRRDRASVTATVELPEPEIEPADTGEDYDPELEAWG
jgi:hypothetical protein